MLKGRLGLAGARVPQSDRHGVLWLDYGRLLVESGTLRFVGAAGGTLAAGDYAIPYQMLNCILLGPGTSVTHDALRILARHGTGLVAIGEAGTRYYASLPAGPGQSALARKHAIAWVDEDRRLTIARKMYALRLDEILPHDEIEVLRGIEGARAKRMYVELAERHGVEWHGRRFDRQAPEAADEPNQAINHASVAVTSAAELAYAVAGAIPQLGFIHEAAGHAFALDIADLHRDTVTLPSAFAAVQHARRKSSPLEREVRRLVRDNLRSGKVVAMMIDQIKELLDDGGRRT